MLTASEHRQARRARTRANAGLIAALVWLCAAVALAFRIWETPFGVCQPSRGVQVTCLLVGAAGAVAMGIGLGRERRVILAAVATALVVLPVWLYLALEWLPHASRTCEN